MVSPTWNWLLITLQDFAVAHVWPLLGDVVAAAVVMIVAYAAVRISGRLIWRFFRLARIGNRKRETVEVLLNSAIKYIIYIMAGLLILTLFGVEIKPLLAGLGIAGIALGFGAQSLIKDVFTGFFIIFEDQLHVGDYVEINGQVKGTVEEVGIRMTAIREWSGKKFYLANSEIKTVRNYSREELRAIVTASFPFSADPHVVREVLEEVCNSVRDSYYEHFLTGGDGNLEEAPQVYGVTDIDNNDRGAQYTIIAKIKPSSLWIVEKALREAIWEKCRERGIQLACPQRYVCGYTERKD